MNAKEKALELVNNYSYDNRRVQNAIIAVNEILRSYKEDLLRVDYSNVISNKINFYNDVLQELLKNQL